MSFYQELKRRNVFRMAVLYIVTAWLVLQVADVLFDALELPVAWTRLVLALLVIGFPIALVFSWVYELTPGGLQVDSGDNRQLTSTRKLDYVIIGLLSLAIVLIAADRLVPEPPSAPAGEEQSVAAESTADPLSIAVLPFADLSAEQDQQYFADGLSEELLNLLVRNESLHVISRTSSFAMRDSGLRIPEIADALSVAHILEGSVRKDGDRLRITAQLIETASDRHIWSENFDRDLDDVFAIQDEISNAIVRAIARKLSLGEPDRIVVDRVTDSADAYELYLNARELFIRRRNLPESIRLFEAAIELDPEFAKAWEGLAAVQVIADDWLHGDREDGIDHMALARAPAERALKLDPDLSLPYAVLGQIHSFRPGGQIEAIDNLRRAVEQDPRNLTALHWLAAKLKYAGYLEEARDTWRRCLDIDPARAICTNYLAEVLLFMGEEDTAIELHNRSIEESFFATSPSFVSTYLRRGDRSTALLLARRLLRGDDAPYMEWIRAMENSGADNSAGLARLQEWVDSTDVREELPVQLYFSFKAWDELTGLSDRHRRMLFHPDAEELRRTEIFKQIIRHWGYDDLWRARGFPPQCRAVGEADFSCS